VLRGIRGVVTFNQGVGGSIPPRLTNILAALQLIPPTPPRVGSTGSNFP
jgi:hypothetical protein